MQKVLKGQLYIPPHEETEVLTSAPKKKNTKVEKTSIFIFIIILLNIVGIIFIITSLFSKTSVGNMVDVLNMSNTKQSIIITITSILISLLLICVIGIPVSYILARKQGRFYAIIEMISSIPIVLPPSVAGLALLMTFGKRGMLGKYLLDFGIQLPFTYLAIIIVQVFITLPFFIQVVKNGFSSVEICVEEAAKVFGAGEKELLFKIYIPIAYKPILAAMIMCSLRAAGEFGATIMFAGNLAGKTQTITTQIYSLYQSDILMSVTLAAIQVLMFLIPFFILKLGLKH